MQNKQLIKKKTPTKQTNLKQNQQPLLQNQQTTMQNKRKPMQKPTVLHLINTRCRVKSYRAKSHLGETKPGENVFFTIRECFHASIQNLFQGREGGGLPVRGIFL